MNRNGMSSAKSNTIELQNTWLMSRMSAGENFTRVVIDFIKPIALKLYMIQTLMCQQ